MPIVCMALTPGSPREENYGKKQTITKRTTTLQILLPSSLVISSKNHFRWFLLYVFVCKSAHVTLGVRGQPQMPFFISDPHFLFSFLTGSLTQDLGRAD